jgi:hypothetical protein
MRSGLTLILVGLLAWAVLATPVDVERIDDPPVADELPALIASLSSEEPSVREVANQRLLLTPIDDLPALRNAVAAATQPADTVASRRQMREVIRRVVWQAHHDAYRVAQPGKPMIGIQYASIPGEPPTINACIEGYAASRVLRPGDVVHAVRKLDPADAPWVATPTPDTLFSLRVGFVSGEWLGIRILREGELMERRIRVMPEKNDVLDVPRHGVLLPPGEHDRIRRIWLDEFVPLLGVGASDDEAWPETKSRGGKTDAAN